MQERSFKHTTVDGGMESFSSFLALREGEEQEESAHRRAKAAGRRLTICRCPSKVRRWILTPRLRRKGYWQRVNRLFKSQEGRWSALVGASRVVPRSRKEKKRRAHPELPNEGSHRPSPPLRASLRGCSRTPKAGAGGERGWRQL